MPIWSSMLPLQRSWLTKVCHDVSFRRPAEPHISRISEENALRTSTGLETLTLKDLHYLAREEVRWLLLLLSRIPPSAFRKLEFVCTSSSFDGVDEHSLELLDEFLASPAFSQLEEVELDFSNGFKQRDLSGVVTRGLRRLGERGALRAHFPAFSTEVDK